MPAGHYVRFIIPGYHIIIISYTDMSTGTTRTPQLFVVQPKDFACTTVSVRIYTLRYNLHFRFILSPPSTAYRYRSGMRNVLWRCMQQSVLDRYRTCPGPRVYIWM